MLPKQGSMLKKKLTILFSMSSSYISISLIFETTYTMAHWTICYTQFSKT